MEQKKPTYKKKEELLQECLAYTKYGQDIHPVRVQEMVKDAFKDGYERAIKNYG